jgi:calcium-dependent protein kinase
MKNQKIQQAALTAIAV